MSGLTVMLDARTGAILVAELDRLPKELRDRLAELLGDGVDLGCARPLAVLSPPEADQFERAGMPCVRVAGYYHDSLVEGPGRRTSVLFGGCDLACPGCWVPLLHPADAGILTPADRLAKAVLNPGYERDGVSILGGEAFMQPEGLLALVRALRRHGCSHVLVYSGYTYEALLRRSRWQPAIGQVFDEADVLIDGPYVKALADTAGPWTGSGNQRVIDLVATRQAGRVTLLEEPRPHSVDEGVHSLHSSEG